MNASFQLCCHVPLLLTSFQFSQITISSNLSPAPLQTGYLPMWKISLPQTLGYFVYFVIIFWRISVLAYRGHQRLRLLQSQRGFFGLKEGLLKGAQVVLGQEGRRRTSDWRWTTRRPEIIFLCNFQRRDVDGKEVMTDLLALQPALPRLRSLRPASKVARLADSLNNIWLQTERVRILLH